MFNLLLIKIKNSRRQIFFILIFGLVWLYAQNVFAQTEGTIDTTQSWGTYYASDYAVDTILQLDLISWDLNAILEKDSLELGKVYEINQQFVNFKTIPIILKDITQSCSCLEPDWYKLSITPGGTGWIKIKYIASIPDKKYFTIKLIGYDASGVKPLFIQPVKIAVNVKYNITN
jgi:hypothetical protein